MCIAIGNKDDIATVSYLLAHGADPDLPLRGQRRALRYAIRMSRLPIVQLLLDAGADPNVQSDDGTTPLIEAIRENQTESVQLLLQYGADPLLRGAEKKFPIEFAKGSSIRRILRAAMDGARNGKSQ